jgi:AcrR family transcriptional regulator
MSAPVKSRGYDGSSRRRQAQQRRRAVLDTAQALFLTGGYAATTISRIAVEAGVSAETVYKAFGSKAGIVRALHSRALEGAGPEPAEQRSDRLRNLEDPRAIIAGWARLAAEVAPRVSPLLLLGRDAAVTDPTMRVALAEMNAYRARRMQDNARALARHLRRGLTVPMAADVLYAVSSSEMYELLVVQRGWSLRRYARYVDSTLVAALL